MPKNKATKKAPTPPAPEPVVMQEESPALPIFMEWSVVERTKEDTNNHQVKHFAHLYFQGTKTHTLEGPLAAKILQEHADRWNVLRYIPKLDVHPGYFKTRPCKESFLYDGRGEKPFVT